MAFVTRLLQLIPVWLAISLLAFGLGHLTPGDPARLVAAQLSDGPPSNELVARVRTELGLDKPLPIQYVYWLGNIVQGDWGTSFRTGNAVLTELVRRFPATLRLAALAFVISVVVAPTLGVLAALYKGSVIDQFSRLLALVGASLPSFWLAFMLIIVFSVNLKWLPVSGQGSWQHLILPATSLSLISLPSLMRLTRSSLLDVLQEDYLRTAQAKGLRQRWVILKHALRNAFIPVVTVAGMSLGHLLGGAAIIEIVFAYPGVGKFLIDSIGNRDYPVIQAYVLFLGTIFVVINLLIDVVYTLLDPRISLDQKHAQHV
ncbi:MAG: nickel ABC transporter permease [Deinococcota bacterium]